MGNDDLDATEWGFKLAGDVLVPVSSRNHVAPRELILLFSCNCAADGCKSKNCSCRNNGVACTDLCGKCRGETCNNPACEVDDISGDTNPVLVPAEGSEHAGLGSLAYTVDGIKSLKSRQLIDELACFGVKRGRGKNGKL